MKIARISVPDTERTLVSSFGGYDRRDGRAGISFREMENMTGKYSPLLSVRDPRKVVDTGDAGIKDIYSLDFLRTGNEPSIAKNALFADCGSRLSAFYTDGEAFTSHDVLNTSSTLTSENRFAVISGSKLCFFPDAVSVDLMSGMRCEELNCSSEYHLGAYEGYYYELKLTPCDIDGNEVEGESAYMAMTRPYYSLSGSSRGAYKGLMGWSLGFSDGDTVKLMGLSDPELNDRYFSIVRVDRTEKRVVISCPKATVQSTGTVYMSRTVPDMDFVVSAGNRLWGCKYGVDSEGNSINEIYASALGDPKNWRSYGGISTDSWTASVGAPGAFTGAVSYNGHPIFFKEDFIIKVFGDYPADFSVSESRLRGVEAGSDRSIAVVNDTLYYKSCSGFVKYDGGIPRNVDAPLGTVRYKNAVAGAVGSEYYVSAEDEKGDPSLFVYDAATGVWHREDSTRAVSFCRCGTALYMLTQDGRVLSLCGSPDGDSSLSREGDFHWSCTTNSMGFDRPDHKYVSRLSLRLETEYGCRFRVLTEYDCDGIWHDNGVLPSEGDSSLTVSVTPRRCDSFRLRIEGRGALKLRSVTTVLERADR